jgi:hypothetical protein
VAYFHNTVFGQKYLHYQRGMGRGIAVQQEQLPSSRNYGLTRQMLFNNLPITLT